MPAARRVVVLGFDGLDGGILRRVLACGEAPHFAALAARGHAGLVRTTTPAQTPVAWSTFATGVNPGAHGIFDFLARDPKRYSLRIALSRYEMPNLLQPPRAVNLRRAQPLWDVLSAAGVPSVVLRCPCSYPPDRVRGRVLAGMGVPDLRGSFGTPTLFTEQADVPAGESESVQPLTRQGHTLTCELPGPLNPVTRAPFTCRITLAVRGEDVALTPEGQPSVTLTPGQWSPWLRVKFKTGLLQSARGMVRVLLRHTTPHVELYATPVHFDLRAPLFPISHPEEYAEELAEVIGDFATSGMPEDHAGLLNGRLSDAEFLAQCEDVWREREAMLFHELARLREGFLYCLFDTPDRVQHLFWGRGPAEIDAWYRRADDVLGRVLAQADDDTLVLALSDHGFGDFARGLHLNSWLHQQGLLALRDGAAPADDLPELLQAVDWSRTRAYALGLGGIYLNLAGREAQGIVAPEEAAGLAARIAAELTGLIDPRTGLAAVRGVPLREACYRGPYLEEAPDLLVHCAAGYRASWQTGVGGVPAGLFADNTRLWRGDHIVDPALVPGVLYANRPLEADADMRDLAPTILTALGVPVPAHMEGRPLC